VDGLSRNISVRSSLIKLIITLATVISTNLILVTVWSVVDPYSAQFKVVDTLNLNGRWFCTSNYLTVWLILEFIFLMGLICFGVYVIYYTWSFQRQALIAETRWVLIALYNIILNLAAALPVAALSISNDDDLAVLMMISLIFSGGGIVLAFLLPRSIQKLLGESFQDSDETSPQAGSAAKSSKATPQIPNKKLKSTKETSRTPVEELSLRLESPHHRSTPEPEDERPYSETRELELLSVRQTSAPSTSLGPITDDHLDDDGRRPREPTGIQRLEESLVVDPLSSSSSGAHSVQSTPLPTYRLIPETPTPETRTLSWSANPLSILGEHTAEDNS
jgi:hypothetical protein